MRGWILGAGLLAACSADLEECSTDAECARLGDGLFCYDRLCVENPPGVVLPEPEPPDPRPPAAEPHVVACGAIPTPQPIEIDRAGPGLWTLSSDTGGTRLAAHRCGGSGEEAVLRLNLEDAGAYTFVSLSGTAFNPLLAIRETCVDPASERACDQATAGAPAVVQLQTETDDRQILLFVDGPGTGGSFGLTVTHADAFEPPELISTAVRVGGTRGALRVAGSDINGDAEVVEVTWLNADEVPVAEPAEARLSPSPLGSREFTARATTGAAPDSATHAAIRLRDRQGAYSAPTVVEVQPLVQLEGRAPCDPLSVAEHCAPGWLCPVSAAPVCSPSLPPQVLDARASVDGLDVIMQIDVSDPNGDLAELIWQPMTAAGEPLVEPASLTPFEPWTDAIDPVLHARATRPGQAEAARVWVVDAAGDMSAPFDVRFERPPRSGFTESCDPLGLSRQCEPELYCRVRDTSTCWSARAVRIEAMEAWFNAESGAFGVFVHANSADGLTGVEFGGAVHLFHRVEQSGSRVLAWGSWVAERAPSELRVQTRLGVATEPIRVDARPTPEAPMGGGCDPLAALARCPAGSACIDPDRELRFRCVEGGAP